MSISITNWKQWFLFIQINITVLFLFNFLKIYKLFFLKSPVSIQLLCWRRTCRRSYLGKFFFSQQTIQSSSISLVKPATSGSVGPAGKISLAKMRNGLHSPSLVDVLQRSKFTIYLILHSSIVNLSKSGHLVKKFSL